MLGLIADDIARAVWQRLPKTCDWLLQKHEKWLRGDAFVLDRLRQRADRRSSNVQRCARPAHKSWLGF
jgi:hypothetical protein